MKVRIYTCIQSVYQNEVVYINNREGKKSISRDKLYQCLIVHGCLSWRPTALLIYEFTIYYMNKEDNYNSTLSA